MTNDELMALKAKAEAATPGPWLQRDSVRNAGDFDTEPEAFSWQILGSHEECNLLDYGYALIHGESLRGSESVPDFKDIDYIVAACNAVPGLVGEVLRLREMQERAAQVAEMYMFDFLPDSAPGKIAARNIAQTIRELK